MVIATQNPIEQEGTYNLPEAQLDRFMMHLEVNYPNHHEELLILELDEQRQHNPHSHPLPVTTKEEVLQARKAVSHIFISENLKKYIVSLITATRTPEKYDRQLAKWMDRGASPRATISMIRCAKALAWLRGDDYVTPLHIHSVAPSILRHRIVPSFESEGDGISRTEIVRKLLEVVAIP
jgi:MoxR-like ATPase